MCFLRSVFTANVCKINEINEKETYNKQNCDIYVQKAYKIAFAIEKTS